MKKIIVILAALAGLCFTSCSTTEGTVYIITDTVGSHSIAGNPDGDGYAIYNEFTEAIIAWDNLNASGWQWTTTTKNGKYTSADEQAIEKFQTYATEYEALYKVYQAKFDALTESGFSIDRRGDLKLQRIGEQSKELVTKSCTLKK